MCGLLERALPRHKLNTDWESEESFQLQAQLTLEMPIISMIMKSSFFVYTQKLFSFVFDLEKLSGSFITKIFAWNMALTYHPILPLKFIKDGGMRNGCRTTALWKRSLKEPRAECWRGNFLESYPEQNLESSWHWSIFKPSIFEPLASKQRK